MKWSEFKRQVEAQGVTDDTEIGVICTNRYDVIFVDHGRTPVNIGDYPSDDFVDDDDDIEDLLDDEDDDEDSILTDEDWRQQIDGGGESIRKALEGEDE